MFVYSCFQKNLLILIRVIRNF